MPVDPSIALEAGKPTALSQQNQVPNYLANPQSLNALLQMSGQVAAGKALQQSIGPEGNIDFQGFANRLANNPQAAPYAFQAMNQGLDAAGKQIQQQITRRQQGASLITPLLLDPQFNQKNPEYAQKELHKILTKGVEQGTIDNKTAIYFGSNVPTMMDNGREVVDVGAMRKELTRALISILPPAEQKAAITGQVTNIDFGGHIQPSIINSTLGTIDPIGSPIPKSETQGVIGQPITGTPTSRGEKTAKPLGANMPLGGGTTGLQTAPNTTGAPRVPGQGQAAPTSPVGTGRYTVSEQDITNGVQAILAAQQSGATPEAKIKAMRKAFDELPAAVQTEVAKRLNAKKQP